MPTGGRRLRSATACKLRSGQQRAAGPRRREATLRLGNRRHLPSHKLREPWNIDTPVAKNAKNYLRVEPQLPPPLYAPEVVAEAVLHCCEHPRRELMVGAVGSISGTLETVAPALIDRMMEWVIFRTIKTDKPANQPDGLHTTASRLQERSGDPRLILQRSYATKAKLHPVFSGMVLIALGASLAAWASRYISVGSRHGN